MGCRLDPCNWRPLSLLNVDYKIVSSAIAGRLLKAIHLVVKPDQSCGVPGRSSGDAVAFLRDVVSFASSSVPRPLSCLSIRRRASSGWTGVSSVPLWLRWGSGLLSLGGSIRSIPVYRVLLKLTVTCLLSLHCLVGSGRAVHCLHCCTFSILKTLLATLSPILVLKVCLLLVPLPLYLQSASMQMTLSGCDLRQFY